MFMKMGRLHDAKAIIRNLWGPSEVEKAIEEFQSVLNGDGGDMNTKWSELLEEPHYKGCINVCVQLIYFDRYISVLLGEVQHLK